MMRNAKPFHPDAVEIITKRYLHKDPKILEVLETIDEFFPRVARSIAEIDKKVYGASDSKVERLYEKFLNVMDGHRVIPAGRTLANAGLDTSVVPNCVVLHIKDSLKGISKTESEARLLQQAGCGIGFPFGDLREAGSIVSKSRSYSSGAISFLRVYHEGFATIQQQNRHGSNMATFPCDHPDILEFISCKEKEGDVYTFNISVLATDEFMETATNPNHPNYNKVWMCKFGDRIMKPRIITRDKLKRSTTIKEVDYTAKEIFDQIIYYAWKNGEPGVCFVDEMNRKNPLPQLGPLKATNPCLTIDTWVMTDHGPDQIKNLIEKNDFKLHVGFKNSFSKVVSNGFFSNGLKDIYQIETKEGISIKCTSRHRFLSDRGNWVYVNELKNGDKLSSSSMDCQWIGEGTYIQGYLLGQLKGNGYLHKSAGVLTVFDSKQIDDESHIYMKKLLKKYVFEEFGKKCQWNIVTGGNGWSLGCIELLKLANKFGMFQKNKMVSDEIEKSSYVFYIGFLRGFFDADGSVQGHTEKGRSIRLSQSSLQCLHRIQRMLLRIGIFSKIYPRQKDGHRLLPNKKGSNSLYYCKAGHELIISRKSIILFKDKVGFYHVKKSFLLNNMINNFKRKPYKNDKTITVKNVFHIGMEEIYNVTLKHHFHAFESNGLISANCGEQGLHDGDVCLLINVNLSEYVIDSKNSINWDLMEKDLKTAVVMGDNICEMYDVRVKRVSNSIKNNRRIGIGPMGFGDMCLKLGIRYGSVECIVLIEKIMQLWKKTTVEKSQKLAMKRGPFPNWEKSIYFLNGEPIRRNAALTNAAPTGTIARIAYTSSGIEPNFMFAYQSNVLGKKFINFHYLLEKELERLGLNLNEEIVNQIKKEGTIQNIEEIPKSVRDVFVCAMDLSPEEHILVQSTFQKYMDNSISKTVNYPEHSTIEDIKKGYVLAWQMKCKGFTVYRNNSREMQVLEKVDNKKEIEKKDEKMNFETFKEKVLSQLSHISENDLLMIYNLTNGIPESKPSCSSSSSDPDEEIYPIPKDLACFNCKSTNMSHSEGCVICMECAWSPCAN